jgi:hypothetical protein
VRLIKTLGFIAISALALNLSAQELTGRAIMQAMEDTRRSTNDSSFTTLKLSSCKFGVNKGRIACAERPRVKVLESVAINHGKDNKDTKSVSITLEPAAERGISMLTYGYDEGAAKTRHGYTSQPWAE